MSAGLNPRAPGRIGGAVVTLPWCPAGDGEREAGVDHEGGGGTVGRDGQEDHAGGGEHVRTEQAADDVKTDADGDEADPRAIPARPLFRLDRVAFRVGRRGAEHRDASHDDSNGDGEHELDRHHRDVDRPHRERLGRRRQIHRPRIPRISGAAGQHARAIDPPPAELLRADIDDERDSEEDVDEQLK